VSHGHLGRGPSAVFHSRLQVGAHGALSASLALLHAQIVDFEMDSLKMGQKKVKFTKNQDPIHKRLFINSFTQNDVLYKLLFW
jgi:hypothetical protein